MTPHSNSIPAPVVTSLCSCLQRSRVLVATAALQVLVLGSLVPRKAEAADVVWINPGTGAWENVINWSGSALPQIGDHAFINNGGTAILSTQASVSAVTVSTSILPATGGLSISGGGKLSVNNGATLLNLAGSLNSTGVLSIEGSANAGVLNASGVHGGAGTAILNFNHTATEYYFTKDGTATGAAVVISGSTSVKLLGTGKTILTGVNTHTGGTTVSAGALQLGNGIDAASLSGKNGNDVLALEDDAFAMGGTGLVAVTINNNGGTFNVLANATVTGGKGGDASIATYGDSMGGSGGAGTIFNGSGTLTNAGTISGGNGGYVSIEIFGDAYGGWGGTGVSFGNSSTLINAVTGIIRGGSGGDGLRDIEGNEDLGPGIMETGDGGAGASFLGIGTVTNAGLIAGGNGGFADGGGLDNSWGIGDQNNGYGGDGGEGVMFYYGGTITNANTGTISGGHGGDTDTFRSNGGNTFGLAYAGDGAAGAVLWNGGTVTNDGAIKGGNGGSGSGEYGYGGLAAPGVFFRDGGELTNNGSGTIDGGNGGNGMGMYGGRGGAGVEFKGTGAVTNSGAITGGSGGFDPYEVGGNGASAVLFTNVGELNNVSGGTITGGRGGNGGGASAGSGAAGVLFTSSGLLINAGTIIGGQGGQGGTGQGFGSGHGGTGGAGVRFTNSGELTNSGTISGNDGGMGIGRDAGGGGAGGVGGSGVEFASGGTLTNSGTITAGNGGNGTGIGVHAGTGGGGGTGVILTGGGVLTNTGTISRGAGGIGSTTSGVVGIGVRFSVAAGTLTNGGNSGGGTINGSVEMADAANAVTLFNGSKIAGGLNMSNNVATTLTLDGSTGSQLYSTAVTGGTVFNGALIKQGAGTWILDQSWTHGGNTTINGGVLLVNGSMTSDTAVKNGGTLGGSGQITGTVTVEDGGTLAAGNSPGTLTVGELILNNGTYLDFELGDPSGTAGVDSDLISVESGSGGTGNLALDGVLNVTNAGSFGAGTFRLINYDGDLTDNGLELGNLLAGYNFTLDTATRGEVNLSADYTGLQFWDGTGPAMNGQVNGGSGTWNAANSNWTDGNGNGQSVWSDLTAVFSGPTGGTVEVDDTHTISGLHFSTDGYVLADSNDNGALSLAVTGAEFRIDAGLTATIAVPLTGGGALSKTGLGTIVLTGVNNHTGGTTITGGTLQLGNGIDPAALVGRDGWDPLPSVIVENNATFIVMSNATVTGGNGLNSGLSGRSGVEINAGGILSNHGTIYGGTGGYSIVGHGASGAAGVSSVTGGSVTNTGTIYGGTGGGSAFFAGGSGGAGVNFAGGGTLVNTGTISGGGAGSGYYSGGASGSGVTFAGAAGALTNGGTGGGGTIHGGVVMGDYANDVTLYTGSQIYGNLDMSSNSAVVFTLDGAGAQLYSGSVSGTTTFNGTLVKQGAGTWTLDQTFTHSGPTNIQGGTLVAGNLANSTVNVIGGAFNPGGTGSVQEVTVGGLHLQGGDLLMDLAAGGVSDTILASDGLASLSAPALFTFNDLGVDMTQHYLLIDGLNAATPWDLSLLSFTGTTGSFLLSEDFTKLYFGFYDGSLLGGRIIQNAMPTGTPYNANFLVDGAVTTGNTAQSNTINSLTFHPGGTLQVFNNLTVTSGNITVIGGTASINGGSVFVPGDFHKNGNGSLVANTFLQVGGASFINQGVLFVNGTLQTSSVHVGSGGVLGGSGLIVGHVINAGLVSPGNSPGTLSIHGNYTQTRTGTLRIEVASPRVFDRLVVSGTARLDGTLDVRNYGGNQFSFGQQVPFLQAGRIVGKFDRILMPQDERFRGRFLNAGHTGILLVAPTSYTLVARTGNETRVAQALDEWIGIEDGDIGEVTLALDLLTEEHYPAAFAAIMPGYYESALNTAIELSHSQGQLLHQQLSARRLGTRSQERENITSAAPAAAASGKGAKHVQAPQVAAAYELRWNAWVLGSGMFSEGGLSLTPGEDFESGTYLAGADYALSEHVSVGLFAGYQEGWSDYEHGGDLDLDSVRFGAYATVDMGGFYAHGAIGGGSTDYDVQRSIRWATLHRSARSDADGMEFFTMLGTGYDFHVGPFTFGPSLSVQYTKVELDGFTERGAGSLNLRIRNAEEESLRTYLGARVACTFQLSDEVVLIPELRAFWQHEFLQGGESMRGGLDSGFGPGFSYVTETPDEDAMYAGAGLNVLFGERLSTSLYYHANFGRNDDAEHTVSLNVNWRF